MLIVTHNGRFHADDLLAVAVLRLLHPTATVVRTRDPELIGQADLVVDVGGRHDPDCGRFDHHQRDFAEHRPNGIPYSAFGLVWRQYGPDYVTAILGRGAVPDRELATGLAAAVDRSFVQQVDAIDSGFELWTPQPPFVAPHSLNRLLAVFNTADGEGEVQHARFEEASQFAVRLLELHVHEAREQHAARAAWADALCAQPDTAALLVLDRALPWAPGVFEAHPHLRYVIYPEGSGHWLVTAVSQRQGVRTPRQPLPAEWAGLSGQFLADVSGVPGATFCHRGRFLAGHRTREGALQLARQALAATAGLGACASASERD